MLRMSVGLQMVLKRGLVSDSQCAEGDGKVHRCDESMMGMPMHATHLDVE